MRMLLTIAALVGLVATAHADDAKPAPKPDKPAPSLKVGDPAPALKADAWLQGKEVTEFVPGKVYVVEFWATWCGPCIVMMPHMSEMQSTYRDKGVTFIGFSAKDPSNTREKVSAFVEKRGPKLGYTFAYGDNKDTYDAWMKAAGQGGIPCSYVVGKDGKLAYIGHPMYLDVVLPKVVDGTWSEADTKHLADIEKDVNGVFQAINKPEGGIVALNEFEAKYPALSHIPYFVGPKISLLVKAGKIEEAKALATEVMEKAMKLDDPTALRSVSAAFQSPEAKSHKDLVDISIKAALAGLKLAGDKDIGSLLNVANAYFAAGDKEKAKDYGAKAVAAADNPRTKTAIENMVKKFEDAPKDPKE
jgi:thiol-disulfide isomerase/thioredoxin